MGKTQNSIHDFRQLIILLLWISSIFSSKAATVMYHDFNLLKNDLTSAQPGDTLLIADGVYHNCQIELHGQGAENIPIVIKAQTNGRVIIQGASNLRLSGAYLQIEGLYFKKGYSPQGSVIEYRNGKEVARHCRITQCVIEGFNPSIRSIGYSWVQLYGKNNRFDHNVLTHKLHIEVTLAVILNGEENQQNRHLIDHNLFADRPVFGSNGAETIRVGTSNEAHTSSFTVIEKNYFKDCDGEVEIVSIKSSDNLVRENVFDRCAGVLAFRHGDRNQAIGNHFLGRNKTHTGGIRIVNQGHLIADNFFYQLTGKRFFAPLALMNAVPNSLPNRYMQVKNIEINNNVWIECSSLEFGVGKDNERTLAPTDIRLINNQVIAPKEPIFIQKNIDLSTYRHEGNRAFSDKGKYPKGWIKDLSLNRQKELQRPLPAPTTEIGASWFAQQKEEMQPSVKTEKKQTVGSPKELHQAIKESCVGTLIELTEGGYWDLQEGISIDQSICIQASKELKEKPIFRYFGSQRSPMITLCDGAKLDIKGIAFDGKLQSGCAHAIAAIATQEGMIVPYELKIEGCEFYHFHESGFAAVRGCKSTFAENITIENSLFRDMSAEGINLSGEKDDIGRYNVEKLTIRNCIFYNLLGSALNLYRGGNDESTSGPYLLLDHCTFVDVCNREQGSAIRMIGVQRGEVTNSLFVNSGQGGASIRLEEMRSDLLHISHINLYQSGRIDTFYGKAIKGNITRHQPIFRSPDKYDFALQSKDPLSRMGTNKTPIGFIDKKP